MGPNKLKKDQKRLDKHSGSCYYGCVEPLSESEIMTEQMTEAVKTLTEAIVEDYNQYQLGRSGEKSEVQERMFEEFVKGIQVKQGKKYTKIISSNSVWGFIVNTESDKKFRLGDILKPAGWAAPARNAPRGNILEGGYTIRWTGPLYLN